MGSYVHEWQCKGSLSSTRSPRRSCRESPCKTSVSTAARRLALMGQMNRTVVNNIPAFGQNVKNKQLSGDFRLSPPANFANSAILPTDKISTFFMQNFLLQKPKDSSWLCPSGPHMGRMIAFATAVRSGPSALRGPLD